VEWHTYVVVLIHSILGVGDLEIYDKIFAVKFELKFVKIEV
jgi:hypothetical protein